MSEPVANQIVVAGEPVLRAPAMPVPLHLFGTAELRALVERMVAAMRAAPGVGLAAPQIGVGLQIFVVEDTDDRMSYLTEEERKARNRTAVPLTAICNPLLKPVGEERDTFYEGCLSVPGYMALVPRFREVELQGTTPEGTPIALRWQGWPARILQHEYDHLMGTLYVDRMLTRSFASTG